MKKTCLSIDCPERTGGECIAAPQEGNKPLTEQEYVEELEKIIIFLCDVYSKYQDSIACQTNDKGMTDDKYFGVFMSLPTIQGTSNRIHVDKIGKLRTRLLNREAPKISFEELYERLKSNRRDKKW